MVFVGDLNGDGKPDLIFLNGMLSNGNVFPGTGLSVLLNNTPEFPNSALGISAATGSSLLAPSAIASILGKNLSGATASASGASLPTELGGITLRVRDNLDVVRLAQLYFVSPSQINFIVPADTPLGLVTLTVDDGSTPMKESANATVVNDVSPGFFNNNGVPSASAVRVASNGLEQVSVYSCTGASPCSLVPIDLSRGPVYLSLYGTGFRSLPTSGFGPEFPICQVGGMYATVQFAGAQPSIPGLDQVNILLPPSLPRGQAPVQCRIGGATPPWFNPYFILGLSPDALWPANPVQVAIQ